MGIDIGVGGAQCFSVLLWVLLNIVVGGDLYCCGWSDYRKMWSEAEESFKWCTRLLWVGPDVVSGV